MSNGFTEVEQTIIIKLYNGEDISSYLNDPEKGAEYADTLVRLKGSIVDGFTALETFGGFQIYTDERGIHLTNLGKSIYEEYFFAK